MKKYFIFILAYSLPVLSFAQQKIAYDNEPLLDKNQVKEDINVLYESLINYHASPFLYTSENDLFNYKTNLITNINHLTETQIHILARKLITKIGCGHTSARPSEKWHNNVKGNPKYLPFDILRDGNKFYVNNLVYDEFEFLAGDELLSINGISMLTIWKDLSNIIERDGLTSSLVEYKILESFRAYFFFFYGKQSQFDVEFINKSNDTISTRVQPTIDKLAKRDEKGEFPQYLKIKKENDWSRFAIDTSNNFAYLKISHFANRKDYKKYYEEVFEIVNHFKPQNLIIDLRGNSGGYFENGNELLRFLTPEPFHFKFYRHDRKMKKNKHVKLSFMNTLTKWNFSLKPDKFKEPNKRSYSFYYQPQINAYKGRLHLITDGGTFSQASLVASQLKQYGANIYGQETGGTANGNNAMLIYKLTLPNSKIRVSIPYYRIESNYYNNTYSGFGLKPDYVIEKSKDKLSNYDQTLKKVVDIILNQKINIIK